MKKIISQDGCKNCEAAKKIYPSAKVIRSEDLISGEYKDDDRDELMTELQMSDGDMPLIIDDEE